MKIRPSLTATACFVFFAAWISLAAIVSSQTPTTASHSRDAIPPGWSDRTVRRALSHSPLPEPTADPTNRVADNLKAAELGHRIFFDTGFSADGSVSCATCHEPDRGFSDGKPLGRGLGDSVRHSMTIWNAAYQRWFFWDGRADSLWAQALSPLESPLELGGDRTAVAHRIARTPSYRKAYESLFGALPELEDTERFPSRAHPSAVEADAASAWSAMDEADRRAIDDVFANVGKALAAYERRLVSRNSAFDRFVAGLREEDPVAVAAYPESARRGFEIFVGRGNCRLCHFGPNFSDGEFHNTGIAPLEGGVPRDPARYGGIPIVLGDPFNAASVYSDDREGEAAGKLRSIRHSTESWGQFRTPSLRNVAITAPYMHEGQIATLRDVVRFYSTLEGSVPAGHHGEQLLVPLNLTEDEIDDLVAFLESLTDTSIDSRWLAPPASEDSPQHR